MKHHLTFLAGMLAIFGIFASLIFSLNENGLFYFHSNSQDLYRVMESFHKGHLPDLEINFSVLYGGRGQLQVLHPLLDVGQFQLENQRPSCDLRREQNQQEAGSDAACSPQAVSLNNAAARSFGDKEYPMAQKKARALELFLSEGIDLPEDFLGTPPFVDRLGNSYAFLLVKKGALPYKEKYWIESHLSYFKVSELKEILATYHIEDAYYSVISRLSEAEVEEIVRAAPLVLTPDYLFLKNQSRYGFSPLSYWVYKRSEFEAEIKNGDHELVPLSSSSYCLQEMGNACWTYNSQYALAYLYRYSLAIVALLGFLFCAFMGLYLKRLFDKHKEQQKQRLSLQVLSHEFRTPVSSMLLIIDQLTAAHKNFNLADQDLLTRLSTEIFRLQRIVEISKTYLQVEGRRIHFKPVEIASANAWITDFVVESNLPLQIQLLSQDRGLVADPFWLKFVLSSLVQNAFAHGMEPVCLRLVDNGGRFKIMVQDQGECEFTSLHQMTDAFVKSGRSKGMGLGLNIVKFIVDEWGGEIQFSKAPTSFTLLLGKSSLKAV